jgi:hypothetical protein
MMSVSGGARHARRYIRQRAETVDRHLRRVHALMHPVRRRSLKNIADQVETQPDARQLSCRGSTLCVCTAKRGSVRVGSTAAVERRRCCVCDGPGTALSRWTSDLEA